MFRAERSCPAAEHTLASNAPPHTDTAAYLLNLTGGFLDDQGELGRAAGYLHRALTGQLRMLGADHSDTLASRNDLAYAYRTARDPDRASPLHEQALADYIRVPGVDHPTTMIVRGNLAAARQHRQSVVLGRSPCRP